MADQDNEQEKIIKRLQSLELRLSRLESSINTSGNEPLAEATEQFLVVDPSIEKVTEEEEIKGLESQIGRFGLPWLGNIVLLFGITFLTQYLMNLGHRFIAVLIGYIVASSIFYLAGYLKKTNSHLAFIFKINAFVLLYYITLRLHFFSTSPIISDKTISVILLLLLVGTLVYISIKNKSQVFAMLSVIFAMITAIAGDRTHFTLLLVTLTAAGTIYLFYRFDWSTLLIITLFLSYLSFLLWLFGNPLMGHPMEMIAKQQLGVLYLFGLGFWFSIILLFRKKDISSDDFLMSVTIINGIIFTLLLSLIAFRFFRTNYVTLFTILTVFCLSYSIFLHSKSDWNFGSAFYSLYGFMAMSIALYGLFGFPHVYLLLSVQSLVVVSMALWFRNRLIVVMNSLLFMMILLVYLLSSKSINGINFSFALISLISARIVNWKRSRLQIKTELIRNLYLIEGFIMVLFALFKALPRQFVTLSWTMAALLYFLLSFILKNVKYRYMALGTMICAAFYLFLIDLARIELIFRVLALLFLSAISIGISIYYTNRIKKSGR